MCVCVCAFVFAQNIFNVMFIMWIYRAPLLCVDVTSDLMDEKTEECLFTHVPSGQHAVSHSPIPDSSKIQLHLKEEIGLKNLSIYVISTLSICVNLTIWFPHHKRFFFFLQPHQPFSSSICLVIHQSIYLIILPNHPFTLPSVCQTISWYPFVQLSSLSTHPTVSQSFSLTMPFSSAWK